MTKKESSLPIVTPIETKNSSEPWYAKGLHFACTGCGQCCTGAPGYVWVTKDEIAAIAAHLGMGLDAFSKRYVRQIGERFSLTEDSKSYDCDFLKGKQCSIYEVRPVQCRTFPWWPQNLASPQAWQRAAACCEGISDAAACVSSKEINTQCQEYTSHHPQDA